MVRSTVARPVSIQLNRSGMNSSRAPSTKSSGERPCRSASWYSVLNGMIAMPVASYTAPGVSSSTIR